jgi:2-polyprenyl-3-methyl-5-hydroxy-6-metoxy-1,4-benzoquinol methylase
MKLDNETLEYLEGKKFSNALKIKYDYYQPIPDRISLLCNLVRGKNVLHLGCLDHLPLIDGKISRNKWLHKELTNVAAVCLGVDINVETRDYVKSKYGFDNIILGDFTQQVLPEINKQQWDYAILGELLEHIDNPVDYLKTIRENYKQSIRKIIITVPNAWTQTTLKMAAKSAEYINSDHRYWFTPYTLAHVLIRSGLKLNEIYFANRVPLSGIDLIHNKIVSMIGKERAYNFTYASSIVAIADL